MRVNNRHVKSTNKINIPGKAPVLIPPRYNQSNEENIDSATDTSYDEAYIRNEIYRVSQDINRLNVVMDSLVDRLDHIDDKMNSKLDRMQNGMISELNSANTPVINKCKSIEKSVQNIQCELDYATPLKKLFDNFSTGIKKSLDERFGGLSMSNFMTRLNLLTVVSLINFVIVVIVLALIISRLV